MEAVLAVYGEELAQWRTTADAGKTYH